MSAADFFAELIREQGGFRQKIAPFRPNSPQVRPAETHVGRGFSPKSPLSPPAGAGETKTPPATDLQSLAESFAAEHGLTAEQCLSILDDDDMIEIQHGDAGMIRAWRTAVESLLFRGEWRPAPPPPEPVLVACETCAHATPVGPGLIDCTALVPSPAAVGPYRRWATDRHLCEQWEAAA